MAKRKTKTDAVVRAVKVKRHSRRAEAWRVSVGSVVFRDYAEHWSAMIDVIRLRTAVGRIVNAAIRERIKAGTLRPAKEIP